MKRVVLTVLSLTLMLGAFAGTANAVPGNTDNNGNHYGWVNGNGPPARGAVPIPETLLLYGAGLAGFAAWNARRNRDRS
jgi:hypothetical protein